MKTSYQFAGYSLSELVDLAGSSPVYVYSRSLIDQRLQHLQSCLPDAVNVHYSLKANPLPQLVSWIAQRVQGLDVASHRELLTAIATGMQPSSISFSGPGKNDKELLAAITANINIHVESVNELQRIADLASKCGKTPTLSIRINPDFMLRQSGMIMGGGPQPFGIDREQVDELLSLMKSLGIACHGLHCYAGSQILSAETIITMQRSTLEMMQGIADQHQLENLHFNIGGGLGIPYSSRDKELDLRQVGDALSDTLSTLQARFPSQSVSMEIGRYLVGEAGIYIAEVLDRKISRGKTYLILNGGLNHHLAATGNLGQVIRRNYPLAASAKTGKVEHLAEETVTVVGPLCTPLDILGNDVKLPILAVGDYVAILQSGAYGASASPHGFLGHPPPLELLV